MRSPALFPVMFGNPRLHDGIDRTGLLAENVRPLVKARTDEGVPSPGHIAAQLNKRATLTPRGGMWHSRACGIRSLLEAAVTILTLTDAARGD